MYNWLIFTLLQDMNRKQYDCPVCHPNVARISNHLKQVHHIDGEERKRVMLDLQVKDSQQKLVLHLSHGKSE